MIDQRVIVFLFGGTAMYRKILLLLALGALSACQTAPTPNRYWVASSSTDEFTDSVSRMVMGNSFDYRGNSFTQAGKYYPFVGEKDGEFYAGVRSGGSYRIPTGTVQLRVDDKPVWTITPEETPAVLVPATAGAPESTSQETMRSMAKVLSPFTAATGDKAKKIIKQMSNGKVLKYRTVGLNQAASSTGEVPIDSSFFEGLTKIGIDVSSLEAK